MAELKGPARIDKAKGMRERRLAGSLAMNQFQKSLSENATRVSKDREELQKMKRQAFDSNDQAERIANLKKTGGKSIDKQILEQITDRGRELAQSHIAAYGPDGNAEMIAQYNIDKANINKDLDDLTMFIGTLDAEVEARDKAIDDETIIYETDENGKRINDVEKEQFKNGVFNGDSDVTLTYVPGQGYNLSGYNAMLPSPKNQNISLNEYAENLRKNGTSYKAISPNAEGALNQYGMNLIDGFGDQTEIEYEQISKPIANPKFDKSKPENAKTNPKTIQSKVGYKTNDIKAMKEALNSSLSKPGFNQITNSKGQPVKLPPENQMWAQLQKAGYLKNYDLSHENNGFKDVSNDVSWDSWKAPDNYKENILKKAYADYLIDTQFPNAGDDKDVITTNKKVTGGIDTSGYK